MKVSALLLSTAALVSADYGCTEGAMACSGTGFVTCNFNNWVYRECGPGTACFMVADNHPTCGHPQQPSYQQPNYPQQPQQPSYPQEPQYPPAPQQQYSGIAATYKPPQEPAYGQQSYCTEGAMKCEGTGFTTCNHNTWVYRACGPGTECFMVADNHPTCGWPKNNYTPKSYPQTPAYPQTPSYPQTPAYPHEEYKPEPPKEYKPEPPKDYKPEPPKEYKPETLKCEKMYGLCLCSDSYSAGYVKGSDCLEYGWENNASCIKKGGKKCDKPAYKPEPPKPEPYKQAPPQEYKPEPPKPQPYQPAPPQEYKPQPYQQAPPPQEYKPEPPKSYSSLSYAPSSPSYGGQQQSYVCTQGAMMCQGTGFTTCDHNNWVYRPCGPGTECFMVAENHPTCGWPRNKYQPSYGQEQHYGGY